MEKHILVASTTIDLPAISPVIEKLYAKGYNPLVYEANKVMEGTALFSIEINDNSHVISYDGQAIDDLSVCAAWYRHPDISGYPQTDKAKQLTIQHEINSLQDFIWFTIPNEKWLNSPGNIKLAQDKLAQLLLAREVGLEIPETLVSNTWKPITTLSDTNNVAFKMSRGLLFENNKTKGAYTNILGQEEVQELARGAFPFPGIWQASIKKAREWRITVVGEETFDAAIYTTEHAKDDWRKYQNDASKVEFRSENFPDSMKEKCLQYLGALGLKFGAFDFIEDHEGKVTFLECNPNGQYMWIEQKLGLPISDAIADALVKIAEAR